MQNLTDNLTQYLQMKAQVIPDNILEKARDCLCDYIAVTEAGAHANLEHWQKFLHHIPAGTSPVLGYDRRTDGKTACLINGFNAHSLEMDDGQRFAMIHLGASIISALISAASENSIEERDFLVGIVMGYEAACRVAIAIQPSHKKCGFHTAGTCGTIGAAMSVAFALKMNAQQFQTVLSAAVASATGLLEIQEQNSELKPYNLGRAAMDGLSAAYMGFTNFVGPKDILGGERGFVKLFSKECNAEKMTELQDYFEIERIYVKPYAACRHCHPAIEAALNLRNQINIKDIKKIVVSTYHLAVKGHDHTRIVGIPSAKLSIPYSVAAALILGQADITAFEADNIYRNDITELTEKVSVVESEIFTAKSPQMRIAQVDITMSTGQIYSNRVDYAKGEPENPMSRVELLRKAAGLLGKKRLEKILEAVYGLHEAEHLIAE